MTQTRPRATFRDVFGVAEFRWMWFAELCSIAGDQLARVALSYMVFRATGSSALTGLTYGLTFAPSLLGGVLLAGVADRFRRREVMVAVDVLRAGLVLAVAIPGLPFWVLCTLVGAVSLLNPVFKAAQVASLPAVLAGERFLVGMAVRNMTVQSAQVLGFGAGGLLVTATSPRTALVVDAVTFALSAALLRVGMADRRAPGGDGQRPGWARSMRQGARMTFTDPALLSLVLLTWMMAALTVYEGLAAPYAAAAGGGAATVGLLLAGDPVGSVVGAYVLARWVPAHRRSPLIGPLAMASAAVLVVCLARPGIVVSFVVFAVSGGLGTAVVMQATSVVTLAVPDEHRGRVVGLSNTGLGAASGLSPIAGGFVADQIGPPATVALFGVAGLVLVIPLAVLWRRAFRRDPRRWDPT
ncbi:MFS transporter [Virgisporangium aurantiacum]|uniref:MFS transporter n=1 Tax=Virgisporangium aurantiacum TaxID=175570 RepID=A0A8J4E4M0_9ACTN|nr:MFS transporter [Virgisporangium aurantiacum]GIJ61183.1 MFS transporter [Virgisporangium aurantiacum]